MAQSFDTYEARSAGLQNAIDALPGWHTSFPPEYGLAAGPHDMFRDLRIQWAIEQFGALTDTSVLELGPLEAGHTMLLHEHGARITAIEANKGAFLRCLVTKEIVGLPRARFLLGDGVQFLERHEDRFDFVVACGVLYHMPDPLRFLEAVAARTDAVYIWTHYVDETALAADDPARKGWASTREIQRFRGIDATLYRRSYVKANEAPEFCGGIFDLHRWMARESILDALRVLGFTHQVIGHDDRAHAAGPCFSIFARR